MRESGSDVGSERIKRPLDDLAVETPRLWSLFGVVRGDTVLGFELR
jgi:hypothetical protein